MGSRNICTICQEVFLFQVEDKDEQPYALKCGHVFHNKCLTQWKANVNKCPQCRATAQNPIRLFFISDSDTNREELDVYMLQAELEKEKSSCHSLKKKNEELRHASESNKEKISKLQLLNDELEHFIPSLKDCINSLRKENKNLSLSIANLENEVKENRMKLQSFSNIRDILDESVDSIEIEKYKNMKPDMIANIVNQWKRNAQYYKQKEMSDRSKYTQLQGDLKKYKEEAVLSKSELLRAKQEVKILRSAVDHQVTCPRCGRLFETRAGLISHERSTKCQFGITVTPTCPRCGRLFKTRAGLISHERSTKCQGELGITVTPKS